MVRPDDFDFDAAVQLGVQEELKQLSVKAGFSPLKLLEIAISTLRQARTKTGRLLCGGATIHFLPRGDEALTIGADGEMQVAHLDRL